MTLTASEAKQLGKKLGINWRVRKQLGTPAERPQVLPLSEWKHAVEVEYEEHAGPLAKELRVPAIDVVHGSWEQASHIALAHILEIPDYYERLDKMEEQAKKEWTDLPPRVWRNALLRH